MKNRAIQKGRHAEQVARNERYYLGLHDHPNFRSFGKPQYLDASGREYRRADKNFVRSETPVPLDPRQQLIKLYVKLPHGVPWFPGNVPRPIITLAPVSRAMKREPIRHVRIQSFSILLPGHRTGHVYVLQSDWNS